jgi:GTP-binding protein
LLTKADKLARGAQQNALLKVNRSLPEHAQAQTFSAPNGQGLEILKDVLDGWLSVEA